jgi:DNA-binding XRE family transcriptional regulator
MARDQPKTMSEWREVRGLSEEDLAQLLGTDARTIPHWEQSGYDPTALRGFTLAWSLDTPVYTIVFGRYLRGLVLPRCQFILAARGRDDLDWKARIVK